MHDPRIWLLKRNRSAAPHPASWPSNLLMTRPTAWKHDGHVFHAISGQDRACNAARGDRTCKIPPSIYAKDRPATPPDRLPRGQCFGTAWSLKRLNVRCGSRLHHLARPSFYWLVGRPRMRCHLRHNRLQDVERSAFDPSLARFKRNELGDQVIELSR